jgi:AcrR family transcriptional regulator
MRGSSRTRPAKPALSRDSIVAAALDLVDEFGTDAVTMRRVATAVDTSPGALYVYVADRRELMALVHDRAVAEVELPSDADGTWRIRLELLVQRTVDALAAHADIAVVGLKDLVPGPHSLRVIEEILRLLRMGGVDDEACAWAVDLFGQYIASSALEIGTWRRQQSHDAPAAWLDLVRHGLPADDYPTMHALAPLLISGEASSRAAWKLRVLIEGILARPGVGD